MGVSECVHLQAMLCPVDICCQRHIFADRVPGNAQMPVTREAKLGGSYKISFETMNLGRPDTEKQADKSNKLSHRWQDTLWKGKTVSLR